MGDFSQVSSPAWAQKGNIEGCWIFMDLEHKEYQLWYCQLTPGFQKLNLVEFCRILLESIQ